MKEDINLLFTSSPHKEMEYFTDEEVMQHLKKALDKGWDINTIYGDTYSHYNALHACAMNHHLLSCEWLLSHGVNPNTKSGNDNTVFTFVLNSFHNSRLNVQDVLAFGEMLKSYGGDLKLTGYDSKTPLELYSHYNYQVEPEIVDYLLENSQFENTFLLAEILFDNKLASIKNLKKILNLHNIDLHYVRKAKNNELNSETYWDKIAFCSGNYYKDKYEYISWLHEKLGFDLESWHTWVDFDGNQQTKYHTNLLGLAIQNKNKLMFDWVVERKPEYLKDKFFVNEKEYNLLEFSLLNDFRVAIQLVLRNMEKEELKNLNIPKLKQLCKDNSNHLTLETFQKTYTALIYKELSSKYEQENKATNKLKKTKI